MSRIKQRIQNLLKSTYLLLRQQHDFSEYKRLLSDGILTVGRGTYGIPRIDTYRGSPCTVTIGSYCSIAPDVLIIAGGIHPPRWVSTYPFRAQFKMDGAHADGMPSSKGDITVGSDVWIGTGATILSGVTIGHGAIISARAVVTRDIPPYAIAGGVPAKVVAQRFEPAIVERLMAIRWWDWPEDRIREAVPLLSSPNIEEFVERYRVED